MKKSLLVAGIILIFIQRYSFTSPDRKENTNLDIRKIEENITKVKKKLEDINSTCTPINLNLKRDPFLPLLKKIGKKKNKGEKKNTKEEKKEIFIQPEFHLNGVIYDTKKPIAILNNKVVEEKEYVGEYQIYKIFPEKIIVRYRNKYFIVKPYNQEVKND